MLIRACVCVFILALWCWFWPKIFFSLVYRSQWPSVLPLRKLEFSLEMFCWCEFIESRRFVVTSVLFIISSRALIGRSTWSRLVFDQRSAFPASRIYYWRGCWQPPPIASSVKSRAYCPVDISRTLKSKSFIASRSWFGIKISALSGTEDALNNWVRKNGRNASRFCELKKASKVLCENVAHGEQTQFSFCQMGMDFVRSTWLTNSF